MREIHKAKRTDTQEWIAGNLIHDGVTGQDFIHNVGNSVNESDKVGMEGCLSFVAFEIDSSTICQCIGFKDKNGKLIFEHHILRRQIFGTEIIGEVVWGDIGFTGYSLKVILSDGSISYYPIGRGQYDDDNSDKCDDEIIGNIFDNPELLRVG